MIQQETMLEVADNSGAKKVKCFKVLKGSKRRYAYSGDVIVCSVRDTEPNSAIKSGSVVRAVIVRTKRSRRRPDGSYVAFGSNSCVLIDEKGNPRGTRVFGSVDRKVRDSGYTKICSLAHEVV